MLTNLMGEKKATKKAIRKALENPPVRRFRVGSDTPMQFSLKADVAGWIQLRSLFQLNNTPARRAHNDDDWEDSLAETQERPSLAAALAAAAAQGTLLGSAEDQVAAALAAAAADEQQETAQEHFDDEQMTIEVTESMAAELKQRIEQEAAEQEQMTIEVTESMAAELKQRIEQETLAEQSAVEATNCASSADQESNQNQTVTTQASESTEDKTADQAAHAAELEKLQTTVKSLERELTLVETKRDIVRNQLEMSEQKADILRDQLLQWQNEAEATRKQLEEFKANNKALKQEIDQLQADNENIAKTVNVAWQQGYLAGRAAAEEEEKQKSIVEQLSRASTKGATTNDTARTDDKVFVISDSPLHIEDPEVLNDPFTAKLLNALSSDGMDIDALYDEQLTGPMDPYEETGLEVENPAPYPEPIITAAPAGSVPPPPPLPQTDPYESGWGSVESEAPAHQDASADDFDQRMAAAELQDEKMGEPAGGPPPLPKRPAPESKSDGNGVEAEPKDANENTQNFTADELHNLFRHRMEEKKEPPPAAATTQTHQTGTTKKFVGSKAAATAGNSGPVARVFPPEIRKACRLLGLNPEEVTTRQVVTEAWKREMSKPGVHPDTGGDTEMAIYLNTAKDALMRWVDDQTPKLGKKFGSSSTREAPKQQKPE